MPGSRVSTNGAAKPTASVCESTARYVSVCLVLCTEVLDGMDDGLQEMLADGKVGKQAEPENCRSVEMPGLVSGQRQCSQGNNGRFLCQTNGRWFVQGSLSVVDCLVEFQSPHSRAQQLSRGTRTRLRIKKQMEKQKSADSKLRNWPKGACGQGPVQTACGRGRATDYGELQESGDAAAGSRMSHQSCSRAGCRG